VNHKDAPESSPDYSHLNHLSAPELRNKAFEYLSSGDDESAEQAFSTGMKNFPNELDQYGHPTFRKELMRMLLEKQRWSQAKIMIPVEDGPSGDCWHAVLFARAYAKTGDYDSASMWWKRTPDHPEAKAWFSQNSKGIQVGNPAKIHPLNDNEFEIGGILFVWTPNDYTVTTTLEKVVILKPAGMLQFYQDYFLPKNVHKVLEFGIWQGGSPMALTHLLNLDVFVGIDISSPLPVVDALIKDKGLDSRISLHYQTSQSDIPAVRDIIKKHFSENSLDLIIDDASHEYEHSIRSFEAAFPYLKPGGHYVIEDWGWSHWPDFEHYAQSKAHLISFSTLVFELVMACASSNTVIQNILVLRGLLWSKSVSYRLAIY